MKISGPTGISNATGPGGARKTSGSGFSLGGAEEAGPASGASRPLGVSAVSTVDALLALQEVDGPLGRRRRAVRRAGRLLDELDQLKLGLLSGEVGESDLRRLASAVREQREATSDPALEAVLDQIEARAAVELAKLEAQLKIG
jgi:hypothetical protein